MGRTKDLSGKLVTKLMQIVVSFAAVLLITGFFAMQAEAATAKVSATSVKIRQQASTSSEMVGSADYGDSFLIQSEVTGADGYVWYQIKFDGTKSGYIRSDLVEKSGEASTGTATAPTDTTPSGVTNIQPISAKVTSDNVRVRPDASTNKDAVTTASKDTTVAVKGMATGADGKTWYMVSFQTANGEVNGFIREDFLQLGGEVLPVTEVEEPVDAEVPVDTPEPEVEVKVKDYETYENGGVWYLINNTTDPAYQYVIEDIFDAANTNAELYNDSLKKIKSQKIFIVILVIVLLAGGVAATFLIFKMKDMLDEAYFAEIEKETISKRQNKQQNVMHTVGKDAQKKPTVNGQQRPAAKAQQPGTQPKQMAKPQTAGQPKPQPQTMQSKPQGQPQPKPQGQPQPKPQQAADPAKAPNPAVLPKPQAAQAAPTAPQTAKPAANTAQPAAKPNKEWKSKNFMADDDDFEFEFLNWDGEEEE